MKRLLPVLLVLSACEGEVPSQPDPPPPLDPCAGYPPLTAEVIPDTIHVNGAANVAAQGGTGRYRYAVVSPTPSGVMEGARYVAGMTPGTDTILVTDDCVDSCDPASEECAHRARVAVEVKAAFSVRPVRSRVPPLTKLVFIVEGNTGIVTFSPQAMGSGGTVAAGVYTAGAGTGTDIIRAIDQTTRDQVDLVVEVTPDANFRPAVARLAVPTGSFAPLAVMDGTGVVTWTLKSGPGATELHNGAWVYVAPNAGDGGDATLEVVDTFLDAGAQVKVRLLTELVRPDLFPQGRSDYATLVVADFDGDGIEDVALGWPDANEGELQGGAVFIFKGTASGLPPAPTWTIAGTSETAQLGFVMAAGDLDGQPGAELAVSAPGDDITANNSGAVYLYRFTANGPQLLRPPLTGLGAGQFGAALAIGDIDGDGDNDLAVGSPAANFAGVNGRGIIDVFVLQPGQPVPDFGEKRFPGLDLDADGGTRRTANINAGRGLLVDDVNGDGRADLSFVSRVTVSRLPDGGTGTTAVPAIVIHLGRDGGTFEETADIYVQPSNVLDGNDCGLGGNAAQFWRLSFIPGSGTRPRLLAAACDVTDSPNLVSIDAGLAGGDQAGGVLLFNLTGYGANGPAPELPWQVTRDEAWARVHAPAANLRAGRMTLLDTDGDGVEEMVLGAWVAAASGFTVDGGATTFGAGGRLDFYSLGQLGPGSIINRPDFSRHGLGIGERLGVAVNAWRGRLLAAAGRAHTPFGDFTGRLDVYTPTMDLTDAGARDTFAWPRAPIDVPARVGGQQTGAGIDVAARPDGLAALVAVPFWHGPASNNQGGDLNAGRAWAWQVPTAQPPVLVSQGAGTAYVNDAGVQAVGAVNQARDVAFTDFNGDGVPDAVVSAQSFPHPLAQADGGIANAATYASPPPGCGAPSANQGNGAVRVFAGRPDGSYAEAFRVWGPREIVGCTPPPGGPANTCIRAGQATKVLGGFDFNGDGKQDVAMLRTNGFQVFLGRDWADPTFEKPGLACDVYWELAAALPVSPYTLHNTSVPASLGDLDGDGCDELAFRYVNSGGTARQGIIIVYGFGPSCGSNQARWLRIAGDTEVGVAVMRLGVAMSRASDMLPDGGDAVAVTADLYPVLGSQQPAVLLLPVNSLNALKPTSGEQLVAVQGSPALTPVPLAPPRYTLSFGTQLHGGLDVDGDGVGDLVVSAPGASENGDGTGAVYVFKGGTVEAGPNQPALVVLPDFVERGGFGQDLALSPPGFGFPAALGIGAPLSDRHGYANGTAYILPLDF